MKYKDSDRLADGVGWIVIAVGVFSLFLFLAFIFMVTARAASAHGNNNNFCYQTYSDDNWNHDCEPPKVDVCSNIEGQQSEVPEGYKLKDGVCIKEEPPVATPPATPTPPPSSTPSSTPKEPKGPVVHELPNTSGTDWTGFIWLAIGVGAGYLANEYQHRKK